MADRQVEVPAPEGMVATDHWWCHYHRGVAGGFRCNNPLDCDISPLFRISDEGFQKLVAVPAAGGEEE